MVKLILPNSAPPGQESQKCLENSATDLVTSRLREVMKSDREVKKALILREVTKAVALFARHFWPPWLAGAELGKMSFTTDFVYENYNF